MATMVEVRLSRQWSQHHNQLYQTHMWRQQRLSSPLTALQLPAQPGRSQQRSQM